MEGSGCLCRARCDVGSEHRRGRFAQSGTRELPHRSDQQPPAGPLGAFDVYARQMVWRQVGMRKSIPALDPLTRPAPGWRKRRLQSTLSAQRGEGSKSISPLPANSDSTVGGPVAMPGAASTEKLALEANKQGTPRNSFTELITSNGWGLWFMLTAALIAAALGGLHALEPGHGKTIVAAYLVGSQGTAAHALLLGLIVTVTHTAGVYALGLITLYASKYIVPDHLYPWLGIASGLTIAFLGLYMLRRRWAGHRHAHGHHHHHGPWGHSHDHGHSHEHTHDHTAPATTTIRMHTPTSTIMTIRTMPGTRMARTVNFPTGSL